MGNFDIGNILKYITFFLANFLDYFITFFSSIAKWFMGNPFSIVTLITVSFFLALTGRYKYFFYALVILAGLVLTTYIISFIQIISTI